MNNTWKHLGCVFFGSALAIACGSDDDDVLPPGAGGDGGTAGSSGSGGTAGTGGLAGSGASAGTAGTSMGGSPQLSLESDTGAFTHDASVTLRGSGFGTKSQGPPFRSSYHHPTAAQNFQQSGSLDGAHWAGDSSVVSLEENLPGVRVTGRASHQYYVRLEYSERGNWGSDGYSAGVQTDLPPEDDLYLAWWDYFEAGFDASHMETGAANFKWFYNSPGQPTHQATQVVADGSDLQIGYAGGIGGATDAEQDANLILPFGGGFYARPLSFRPHFTLPVGEWYFVEIEYHMNTSPGVMDGWNEMRVNNQLVFRANAVDFQDPSDPGHFAFFRFGGNYGFDTSGEVYFRQYGDLYVDSTFARVVLGDLADYEACTHLEVQVPTEWTDETVRFTLNQGSFQPGEEVYLHVIDAAGAPRGSVSVVLE